MRPDRMDILFARRKMRNEEAEKGKVFFCSGIDESSEKMDLSKVKITTNKSTLRKVILSQT